MADQILNKRSVGIPPDIILIREEVSALRTEAEGSANTARGFSNSSALSAEQASESASSAADSARQAAEWAVINNQGLRFGPTEPPIKIDGMLWLKTDEAAKTITGFERWDANAAGAGLFPAEDTYPGEETYPSEQGEWAHFKIAASVVA